MNPEVATRSSVLSQFRVLVCENCNSNVWVMETEETLRCRCCRVGLPVHSRIVDCSRSDASANPIIHQWNDHYRRRQTPYSERTDWWTLSAWREHLFGVVSHNLANKLVVDFGCGTAVRIAALAPIGRDLYQYVGIDSSIDALERAATALPNGFFVHADLGSFRPQPETADVVLCLGVLMYFTDYLELLERLLRTLKPGGIMLLHEQIRRVSWRRLGKGFFQSERHPLPNGYGCQLQEITERLATRGEIIHKHVGGSPLRRMFMKLTDGTPFEFLRPYAERIDSIWCSTVGSMIPAVGAAEVQLVFQRS